MADYFHIKRIEFIVTKRCSGHCKHCSVITADKNPDSSYENFIKLKEAVLFVLNKFSVESLMTYGGEPLLYPEITTQLHQIGQSYRISNQELITNGYFSKNINKIESVVNELIKSGVNRIFLSVDSFHQEHIPIEFVEPFIKSVLNVGFSNIMLHPSWLISPNSDNEYNNKTKDILNNLQKKFDTDVSYGNVIVPAGASRKKFIQYYKNVELDLSIRCGEIPYTNPLTNISNLRFLPNGDVNICRGLCIGNIFSDSMNSIFERYDPFCNSIMSMMLKGGVKNLTDYLFRNNVKIDASQYYGLCDFCTDCIKNINSLSNINHNLKEVK